MDSEPRQWLAELLSGVVTAEQFQLLTDQLINDAELRREYRRQIMIHALLEWRHGNATRHDHMQIDTLAVAELLNDLEVGQQISQPPHSSDMINAVELHPAIAPQHEQPMSEEARWWSGHLIYLGCALAASLLLLLGTYLLATRDGEQPAQIVKQQEIAPVPEWLPHTTLAQVRNSVHAKLARILPQRNTTAAIESASGTRLTPGAYRLEEGVVELILLSGVELVVEAPSMFELRSDMHVKLPSGRLVGNVPPNALGFSVDAGSATIVDLGTEFGVYAAEDKAVDVTVFDGEVEVSNNAGLSHRESQRLAAHESLRVLPDGKFVKGMLPSNLYFRSTPDPKAIAAKQDFEARWEVARRHITNLDTIAYYPFAGQFASDTQLRNYAIHGESSDGSVNRATWVEGRWPYKQALEFARVGAGTDQSMFCQMNMPGRYSELTIAIWLKIEAFPATMADGSQSYSSLLMSNGGGNRGSIHWQLNSLGQLTLGVNGGDSGVKSPKGLESTDLGRWILLALTCQPELQEAEMYLDGESLGKFSLRMPAELELSTSRIGGWLPGGHWDREKFSDTAATKYRTLFGTVDELIILSKRLSAEDIATLVEEGRP